MMDLFKLEIKRALLNKNFFISILISLIVISISLKEPWQFRGEYSSVEAWMRGIGMGNGIMILFIPFLVSIAYSTSLAEEKKNNYLKYIYIRVRSKRYLWTKGIINALVGGISVLLPAIILLIVVSLNFKSTRVIGIDPYMISNDPLAWIMNYDNTIYLLLQCMWLFFQGIIWATFSFIVSLITKKFITVIMVPFIYYIGANFLLAIMGLGQYTPPSSVAPYLVSGSTIISMMVQPILIILIIFSISMFYLRFEDEYYL